MTENNKEETQLYLETFLPDAISQVMESYQDFLGKNCEGDINDIPEEKMKSFLEFHKAIKAALSNIEHLLKFYKWVENEGENENNSEEIKNKIEKAEQSIIEDLSKIHSK